jgi:hypothetical protein
MIDKDKKKLIELMQNKEKFALFLSQLSKEDQEFYVSYTADLASYIEANPLLRFKKNNLQQQEFLAFDAPFQYFIGGNKGGKTATITYKAVLIALGEYPKFERKPLKGFPLINWLCGENRSVIEQTPIEELTKWLRPDQWKKITKGTTLERIRIFIDDSHEIYSDFIIKPYEGGVDIFESANINGVIVADEEIPEDIFRAMIPRMVAHGAWLFNALTPTHGLTYTKDLLDGRGDYAGMKADNLVASVEVETKANIENIDKKMYLTMVRAYGSHNDKGQLLDIYGNPIPDINMILQPNGPEPKLSPEGEIRLKGRFTSLTGKVYPNFKRRINADNWHVFDMHELPDLNTCKFFGISDYGRRDPFVFCLIAVDNTNTHWVLEEEYTPNLETYDQAAAIRRICDNWEARPIMVVADCQIKDRKAVGGTILNDYLTARFRIGGETEGENGKGELILGDNFTTWRARYEDKLSPATARADLGRLLDVNPLTDKPYIRFNESLCGKTINCLERLQWKKTGVQEITSNADDHAEAALRYYTRARITYEDWQTEEEAQIIADTNVKYRRNYGNRAYGGNYR